MQIKSPQLIKPQTRNKQVTPTQPALESSWWSSKSKSHTGKFCPQLNSVDSHKAVIPLVTVTALCILRTISRPPTNITLGLFWRQNGSSQVGTGVSFHLMGRCLKGMGQAESKAAEQAEPHGSHPFSGWRNLGTELRLAWLVLERARRIWGENSQSEEVPNTGYICTSFGLTLNHAYVTHLSKWSKRLLTLAWTHWRWDAAYSSNPTRVTTETTYEDSSEEYNGTQSLHGSSILIMLSKQSKAAGKTGLILKRKKPTGTKLEVM